MTTARSTGRLPSLLGTAFGIAVAVGSMIGAGILRAPHDVASLVTSAPLFVGVWVLGGLYALLGANAIAELGAMRPRSGGQYALASHAFGPFVGFAVGWSDWLSSAASVAGVSIVFAEAVSSLLHAPGVITPLAMTTVVAAGGVLWLGSRAMNSSQQVTSLLKFAGFLVLTVACLAWGLSHARDAGSSTTAAAAVTTRPGMLTGLVLALQGVIFAYDGWVGVLYFGEEVRNPGRDIPRALFGGVLAVMGVYVLLNVAMALVLPLNAIASDPLPTATAAQRVFGAGDTIVRILVVISLPSAILANLGFASRVVFSFAREAERLSALAVSSESGAPRGAVLVSTLVAAGFLATGTFERVVAICSVMFVAAYAVSFAALFRLRMTEPDTPRPFRAIGHPFTTALVLLGSLVFLVATAVAAPRDATIALVLVLVSYPIYRLLRVRPVVISDAVPVAP